MISRSQREKAGRNKSACALKLRTGARCGCGAALVSVDISLSFLPFSSTGEGGTCTLVFFSHGRTPNHLDSTPSKEREGGTCCSYLDRVKARIYQCAPVF